MSDQSGNASFGPSYYYRKPLFMRALISYSSRGQLLSGHFLNKADLMLQYQSFAAHLIIPITLDVYAAKGFKLDRMLLNAARYMLMVHRDGQKLPGLQDYAHFVCINSAEK